MSLDTLRRLRMGQLQGATRLDLSCGLTEFPVEIFDLADSLEVLNLSGNQLSCLPDDLWRLQKMQIIFCSDNLFTELPVVLGACPALTMIGFKANQIALVSAASLPKTLRWLVLTDNRIAELPRSIGDCSSLQKLMLAGNQLADLPLELAKCRQLELIRLAANQLCALPQVLFELPCLSWLAIGDNPFCAEWGQQQVQQLDLASVAWSDLILGELLGEGASGAIYRTQYRQTNALCDAALKLFKGQMTSDGLPTTEMAACCAAGSHPNLIGVLAQLTAHPAGVQGLLLPLIPTQFVVLAQPPSLASCTRDVYEDDLLFELPVALRIARSIAAAAAHLHLRGILHGDLYAHNILLDAAGFAYLGDFGAATMYDKNAAKAYFFEKIEVRAFAALLAELLARVRRAPDLALIFEDLQRLQAQCAQPDALQRPAFAVVLLVLERAMLDCCSKT